MAATKTKKASTRADRAAKKNGKAEEARSGVRVKFDDGYETTFDLNKLTTGEQIELEEYLDMPMGQAWASGWIFSSKASAKIAQLARRRDEPTYTLAEVLDTTNLEIELGVVPPTSPETDGNQD